MKKYKIFIIIGGVLLIVGISFLWGAVQGRGATSFTIPAGADWYYYLEFNMDTDGSISIHYAESKDRPVDVYIMDSSSYNTYTYYGTAGAIAQKRGESSGTISASLTSGGKYYVVFDHGTGYENVSQDVSVTTKDIGIPSFPLLLGLFILLGGIILVIIGYKFKKSEMSREEKPEHPPDDVIMFDRRK